MGAYYSGVIATGWALMGAFSAVSIFRTKADNKENVQQFVHNFSTALYLATVAGWMAYYAFVTDFTAKRAWMKQLGFCWMALLNCFVIFSSVPEASSLWWMWILKSFVGLFALLVVVGHLGHLFGYFREQSEEQREAKKKKQKSNRKDDLEDGQSSAYGSNTGRSQTAKALLASPRSDGGHGSPPPTTKSNGGGLMPDVAMFNSEEKN